MWIVHGTHGEAFGEHGHDGHGTELFDEVVRVPLFIHYPETFPAGQRVAHNVSTRRIFHTILDTAGVHHEGFGFSSNNLSLARSVSGAEAEDETVIAEAYPPMNFINVMEANNPSAIEKFRVNKLRRAIYDGPRKLMTIVDEPIEFFNTTTDPLEAHNLLDGTPAHAASILKLEQALAATVTTLEAHRLGISAGAQQDYSDNPELIERLRGLGYIE